MRILLLGMLCFLGALQSAVAGYNVEATTAKEWPKVAGKIAILPAVCPVDFDCAWLNETVADYFGEDSGIDAVSSPDVSQAMLEAGVDELTDVNREQVAQALGAQSFLVVIVGSAGASSNGAVALPFGNGGFLMRPTNVAQGSIEVRVVSAEGKLLAKASGFGESGMRRKKGVVGKVFGEIFDRLFSGE